MQTIKLSPASTSVHAQANRAMDRHSKEADDSIDFFPQPRYFQVHFQHIHENTHQLHKELAQLKEAVAQFDEKLERLLALLCPADPVL